MPGVYLKVLCRSFAAALACCAVTALCAATARGGENPQERNEYLRKQADLEYFDFEGPTALRPDKARLPVGWGQHTDTTAETHGDYPAYFRAEHIFNPSLSHHDSKRGPATERKCVRIAVSGGRWLEGKLVAGRAAIYREIPRPIDPAYAYKVHGYARAIIDAEHRRGDAAARRTRARLRLAWLDAKNNPIFDGAGKELFDDGDWISFGPGDSQWMEMPELRINDVPNRARKGRLWVMVESTDRDAKVYFDDMSVVRKPRAVLTTDKDGNLFREAEKVRIELEFKGLSASPEIVGYRRVLKILDMDEKEVLSLEAAAPDEARLNHRFKDDVDVPLDRFGPFEAQAELFSIAADGSEEPVAFRQERIGRLRPYAPSHAAGEIYGVDLRPASAAFDAGAAYAFKVLGARLVRIRLWESSLRLGKEPESWRRLDRFLGPFGRGGGRLVGVLGDFPEELAVKLSNRRGGAAAAMRDHPRHYERYVEAAVGRFQFYVDSWQLGPDGDPSFAALRAIEPVVGPMRRFLQARAELKRISIPWPAGRIDSAVASTVADAYTVTVPAELSPERLPALLRSRAESDGSIWLVVETKGLADLLADSKHKAEIAQAADLAKKLILAKRFGADRAFVPRFADETCGLVSRRGPNASYYALSTCARLLTEARYVGPLLLGTGAKGYLFADANGKGLLAAWRDEGRATIRPMYLGEPGSVKSVDLFGNVGPVGGTEYLGVTMQSPELGPEPVFLTGLDLPLMLTRLSLGFEAGTTVHSRFRAQRVGLMVSNRFDEPAIVRIEPQFPKGWRSDPAFARVALDADESSVVPLWVRPGFGEKLGTKEVLIELRFGDRDPIRLVENIALTSDIELSPALVRSADGRLELHVVANWLPAEQPVAKSLDLAVYADLPGRSRRSGMLFDLRPGKRRGMAVPIVLDAVNDESTPIRVGAAERGGGRFINIETTVGKLLSRAAR